MLGGPHRSSDERTLAGERCRGICGAMPGCARYEMEMGYGRRKGRKEGRERKEKEGKEVKEKESEM